jgi:hypothetical protein
MSTFCVLPWYSKEIFRARTTVCCLIPQDADIAQLKQDLLAGKQTPACTKCWQLEAQGLTSRRQQENEFLDYKLNRDLALIEQDCVQEKNQTLVYQVVLSNLCNQACVSCQSAFSTKWGEIELRQGIVPKPRHDQDIDAMGIDYAHARRLSLMGGEPLFDPKTFEILQKLVDAGNTDCFISFVTNGSQRLSDKQLELFKKFSDINICVSIDGIESRFEYLRWPGVWSELLKNMDQYRSTSHSLSVSYTISSLNAIYYDETIAWFESQGLSYNHNIVGIPSWLSLECMPLELKHHLKPHKFFGSYCVPNGKEIALADMLDKILSQDVAKRIDIKNYMPEVWQLLTTTL